MAGLGTIGFFRKIRILLKVPSTVIYYVIYKKIVNKK